MPEAGCYRPAPRRIGLLALAAALLAGCAGYSLSGPDVPPGTPRDAVLARLFGLDKGLAAGIARHFEPGVLDALAVQ